MYEKMLKRLEEKRSALIAKSEKSNDVNELRSIQEQLVEINNDIAVIQEEKREAEERGAQDERTAAVNAGTKDDDSEKRSAQTFKPGKGFTTFGESRDNNYADVLEKREKAGQELKNNRSVVSDLGIFVDYRSVNVGNGTSIVVPTVDSTTINPTFPVVSSLIDNVSHLELEGGESFRQPYISSIVDGVYTAEGVASSDTETVFAYAEIAKAKVTAYAEITEELEKLPAAPYADEVFRQIRTSVRAHVTKQILVGAGNTNQIVGIFSSNATAIDTGTDVALATIDDKTLSEIVYSYGGDEEVEDAAVLILNKADLLAFSQVRTNNKQAFYDIKAHGNYGTINGVPYIINSACKTLTAAATNTGEYCMAYGSLSNYLLVEFSPLEVKKSTDFKFKQGMTAFRGAGMFGGNVVKKNGFLRVKKAAA